MGDTKSISTGDVALPLIMKGAFTCCNGRTVGKVLFILNLKLMFSEPLDLCAIESRMAEETLTCLLELQTHDNDIIRL